jgi:hypothetical protein
MPRLSPPQLATGTAPAPEFSEMPARAPAPDPDNDADPLDTLDEPNIMCGPGAERAEAKHKLGSNIVELIKDTLTPPTTEEAKRRRRADLGEKVVLTPAEVLDVVMKIADRVKRFAAHKTEKGTASVH